MAFSLLRGGSNYPYAVARVQARRAKLIPPSEYEKVLKMDVPEITRYIQDSVYKHEVDELASKFQGLDLLEAALVLNEERTFEDVRRMVGGPGGGIIESFLERYHYEDLKTLIRGKTAGVSRDDLVREMVIENQGAYDIFNPLLAEDIRTIPDVIQALEAQGHPGRDWALVLSRVPAGSPLARYEDALDRAYYAQLIEALEASREKGAKEVLEFIRREVDTRNLLNAARWVAAGEQADFSPYVLPGGRLLKIAQVVELAKARDLDAFAELLAEQRIYPQVKEGLDAARASKRLGPFQAAVWRAHLAEMDKLAHAHPLSMVPILTYLVRKNREVHILRAVARGKAAGLSEERLRELVV